MTSNLALLEEAARKLGVLLEEVVFVGGATLNLMVTDEAAAPIRVTRDVDVIAEIATHGDYAVFSECLRILGFSDDTREDAPLCRWAHGGLTLDVMPLDASILGFTNRWYRGALETARPAVLPSGTAIRLITAPFFLGTKMEAFRSRGARDYFSSHDLEDFIAVVEGRETLLVEVRDAPAELTTAIGQFVQELLDEPRFQDALPGFLLGDAISQQRAPIILDRLKALAAKEQRLEREGK